MSNNIIGPIAFILLLIACAVGVFVAGGNFAVGRKKVGAYCIFITICVAGLAFYLAPVLCK